jgi:HEAT repeat protein
MDEALEKGQESALGEAGAAETIPESEARQVRDLLLAAVKAKRAFEMYPANNPMLAKFQEDILKRFEEFFSEHDRLSLLIRQQEILYKGHQVYHNPEKDDNLALLFYKDGLRDLTFLAGFSGDEVLDFIDVIRARPKDSAESFDDDIVTLLWEKDFAHVVYYVVEEYGEGSALEAAEMERLASNRDTTSGEFSEAYKDAVAEEQILTPLESISMGVSGVFSLGEEEVKSLQKEMEGLTDEAFLNGAINALFESLYLDRGTPDFETLMNNLDSALGYLINTGGFQTATVLLQRFKMLTREQGVFNKKEQERIGASVVKAGSDARVRALAEVLNSGRDINTTYLQLFLHQLDKSAIIPLSNLIAEVHDVQFRKALIEALVKLGRNNVDVLVAGMKDRRWYVVRSVAAILGRIGDRMALEHLRLALRHTEPQVRREAVRSLGMIGGPMAGEALLLAVEDHDPQIRTLALRYLPTTQSQAVQDSLLEIITRSDFEARAMSEKRAFFEVLAEIGQDKVLPFMEKQLKKKALFGGAKNEEMRVSAAYGMGNIRSDTALKTLEKEAAKAKKGTPLYEALSYSLLKLAGPPGKGIEA